MRTTAAIGLVLLLALPCLIGSLSSFIALIASLALAPLLWRFGVWHKLRAQPALLVFLGVFVVLAIIFALTMRQPLDLIYLANFIALPLASGCARRRDRGQPPFCSDRLHALPGRRRGWGAGSLYDVGIRHLVRAEGFIGNANLLPRIAVLLGFVALGGIFLTMTRQRLWFYLGPVFASIVLLLSQSRGAAVGVPALIIIAIIFAATNRSTRRHLVAFAALLVIGVFALIAFGGQQGARLIGTGGIIMSVLENGNSGGDNPTDERLVLYHAGLAAFQARPVIGYGWANLGNAASEVDPEHLAKSAGTRDMFHSDLVNFAVAGGTVGILCWLALLIAPILGALASPRDALFPVRLYVGLVLGVGTAISGATDLVLGYDLHITLVAFLTAIVMGGFRESPRPA